MTNKGVTVRSIIIGLLLIPLNSYWIAMMELIHNSGWSTNISIFFNAILTLSLPANSQILLPPIVTITGTFPTGITGRLHDGQYLFGHCGS